MAGAVGESHGSRMFGIAGLPKHRQALYRTGSGQDGIIAGLVVYHDYGPFLLGPSMKKKEVVQMLLMFKECPFYRTSESLNMGRGVGYCDLDCDRATCEGDQHLCEKPDALKKFLSEQKKREKGMAYFSKVQGIR